MSSERRISLGKFILYLSCHKQSLRRVQMKTTNKALGMIILIAGTFVYAQEAVAGEDFISITEKVVDALDEVETACDDPKSGKQEIDAALKKLRKASDEYKRYDVNVLNIERDQEEIIKTIAKAERSFKLFLFSLGPCYSSSMEDEIIQAKEYADIARELFLKYKAKK